MKFSISPEIFTTFPNYKVGVLIASNVKQESIPELELLKQKAIEHAQNLTKKSPRFAEWVSAFEKMRLSLEVKPSHVALLERSQKSKKLPTIFPVVDFLNSISLLHEIPIGAHDFTNLSGDIEVRPSKATDRFQPRGKDIEEKVEEGIFSYTSSDWVLTKNFIWRQGQTSAVTIDTSSLFIPIDTFDNVSDPQLLNIMSEVQHFLEQYFDAKVQTFIVSKTNPSCEWNHNETMSEDEKQLQTILSRGVEQVLPSKFSLSTLMAKKKIKVYLGIDPTGALLTLGHSVVLRKLQQFADLGHEVYLLIGNGTVRIGDPTGRDSTRPVLTDEVIQQNFQEWKSQASKILDFDKIKIVYNGDWLDKLTYSDIVKLMAKTTVQQLIERDMFQERLKKELPIFGHEIMYPLLQGYDSVVLDVDLEIGGTDQTFNMMMGRHLQREYNNREKWVLSTPIINGTDGRKMSKSFGNFVALTDEPNDMYGKLMSIADTMIIEYFTLLTDVATEKIQDMETAMKSGSNPMEFKKLLAFTITSMYHDESAAQNAASHFEQTIQKKEIPDEIPVISFSDQTLSIVQILKTCLPSESNSNLRRLIEQGGVEVTLQNLEKVRPTDPAQEFATLNLNVIKIGKRKFFKIETRQ